MKSKIFWVLLNTLPILFILPLSINSYENNKVINNKSIISNYCTCKSKPDYYVEVALRQVYVTVKNSEGLHVTDLKPEDFKLWEDGKQQNILFVDKVNLLNQENISVKNNNTAEIQLPNTDAQPAQKRYFSLLIGNLPQMKAEQENSRSAILNFINNVIQPTDYLSLYILTPSGMELIVPFDINPVKSKSAILKFLESEDFSSKGFRSTSRSGFNWDSNDEYIKNFEFMMISKALNLICESLKYISGRKDVILFSEGFFFNPDWEKHMIKEDDSSYELFGPSPASMIRTLIDVKHNFISNDITLQVIDLGSTSNLSSDIVERRKTLFADSIQKDDSVEKENARTVALKTLSASTGGEFYSFGSTLNKINNNLKSVEYDTSFYYILSYTSNTERKSGTYLPISIEVARSGAALDYKRGIVVPNTSQILDEKEQNKQLGYISQSSILYNMISICSDMVVLPDETGKSNIIYGIQMPMEEILITEKKNDSIDLDVFLYLFDKENELVSSFEKRLNMNLQTQSKREKKTKLGMYYSLPLQPGDYRARIFIRNKNNMFISSEEFNVNVPDFAGAELALSSPLLYKKASDVLALNLNQAGNDKKTADGKTALDYLPGLYAISNDLKIYQTATVGVVIKGMNKAEIQKQGKELIKWSAQKSAQAINDKQQPVDINYDIADVIQKPDGNCLILFGLDTRDLQKGEYNLILNILSNGIQAAASIKVQIN